MKTDDSEVIVGSPGARSFFKYASEETAVAILRSRNVRYSSPLTFNDPFDIQSGLHLELDRESLQDKVATRIRELASAVEDPPVDPRNPWGQIVLTARHYYPSRGFPVELWKDRMREPFAELFEQIDAANKEYKAEWRRMLPGLRVFCITEEWDNLLMWAHYAKDHSGAVFEFLSLPDEDNVLSIASPVEYRDSPPPFFSEREWVDDLTGIKEIEATSLYYRYPRVKSSHWAYEKEWRVWYPAQDASETGKLFDDVPIRQNELGAVYLGCKASNLFEEEVRALLASNFPNARLYRAEKVEGAFGLSAIPC